MDLNVHPLIIRWYHSFLTDRAQKVSVNGRIQNFEYWISLRFIKWCDDNHLVLNVNKTEAMILDPRRIGEHRPVVIHDATISQVSFKYLGICIDNSLTWNTHVNASVVDYSKGCTFFAVSGFMVLTNDLWQSSIEQSWKALSDLASQFGLVISQSN